MNPLRLDPDSFIHPRSVNDESRAATMRRRTGAVESVRSGPPAQCLDEPREQAIGMIEDGRQVVSRGRA